MKLLKKLFSFSVGSLSAAIIGVISVPILTRIIEPSEYGIATIFLTIGSLLSAIAIFGLDQAFIRFFYEKNKINLFKKTLFIAIIISFLLTVILFVFNQSISKYIYSSGSYALLLTLYIFIFVVYRFSNLILRMLQFGYRYSLIQAMQKILEFLFILTFALVFSPNHYSILLGTMITMIALTALSLLMSKSFWMESQINKSRIHYKKLLLYSYPLMISTLMALLFQSIDKFVLNYWGSSEELGIYSAGFKLIAVLNILQSSFAIFWAPVSLEHFNKNPDNRNLYSNVAKTMTLTMLSVAIIIILLKDVLVLFLGIEYQSASALVPALVLMPIMYTMSETTVQGINFSMKTHLHIIVSSISLIINVVLSFTLIPIFGMEGAALSIGISYISFYLTRTYFGLKHFPFDIKFKETISIIVLLLVWIILIMLFDNKLILITGAIIIFNILVIVFREEVSKILILIRKKLKSVRI